MPSDRRHRHRSRSPSLRDDKNRERRSLQRRSSVSPGPHAKHPRLGQLGQEEISEEDYFQKSAEFKAWLRDQKGKYMDELTGEEARKYFAKFVKAWNRGKLDDIYYAAPRLTAPSSAQTGYKWKINVSQDELDSIRDSVDVATNAQGRGAEEARRPIAARKRRADPEDEGEMVGPPGPRQGPSRGPPGSGSNAAPLGRRGRDESGLTEADRVLAREEEEERRRAEGRDRRRKERRDEKERLDELAPKATGREAVIERRREKNAVNRELRDRSPGGLEMDDDDLLGGGGSFQTALAARQTSNARRFQSRRDTRAARQEARQAETRDKLAAHREKEAATMAMLKGLADARFGGGNGGGA